MSQYRVFARFFPLLLAVGFVSSVQAGQREHVPVEFDEQSRYVQGAFADARGSADTMQYIGCYSNDHYGSCYAIDAAGRAHACATRDPEQLAIIRSISTDTMVNFRWQKDGTCETITASNFSVFKSMQTAGN